MERHLAAGALVSAGYDVLLADATAVLVKPVLPFLRSQPGNIDLFFQRDDWPIDAVRRMGCAVNAGFVYMRAARGEQVAALVRDMVRPPTHPPLPAEPLLPCPQHTFNRVPLRALCARVERHLSPVHGPAAWVRIHLGSGSI